VPSLNRYNIHKTSFMAAAGFAALSFFIYLGLTRRGSDFLTVVLNWGTVPAALLTFVFGILTWRRQSQLPKQDEKPVRDEAKKLLKEIAQSKAGGTLTDPSVGVVRVAELIKYCEHPMSHTWADRLEKLLSDMPAYRLPGSYGETDGPLLDWYKYDLCIIAAGKEVRFAKAIKRKLLRSDSRLRVYVDETGGPPGVDQKRFIRSVFYGGSKNCLALLSREMLSDTRKRKELLQAQQRAQRVDSQVHGNYLMPIAMDEGGLKFMMHDPYLKKYAENFRVRENQKILFDEIIKILLPRFPAPIPDPSPEPPAKRFAVALSFPGEHRSFVKAVSDELKQRLIGEEVFYDEDYAHELPRPDMDTYLQTIYLEQTELVVAFLCAEYAAKQWCGLEWRAVKELIKQRQTDTVMPVRFDDTHIPGLFSIDGYVNAELSNPEEIADLITRRLSLIRHRLK